MAMPDTYTLVRDFAGPVVTMIAAATAAGITFLFNRSQTRIARSQRDIALDKLKFDLFERRYAIYSAAKELIEHVAFAQAPGGSEAAKIRELYIRLDEARFYFPREQRELLEKLHFAAETFFVHLGQRQMMDQDDSVKWGQIADELATDASVLRAMYAKLPEQFESALSFKQLTEAH